MLKPQGFGVVRGRTSPPAGVFGVVVAAGVFAGVVVEPEFLFPLSVEVSEPPEFELPEDSELLFEF
ncbi:MAG TPA: hypothetical protein PKY59_25485, partial [Pyrinomonadaceae bacterium]|nr:hypothetical protein [Pyrinomonadaceae bacterium]